MSATNTIWKAAELLDEGADCLADVKGVARAAETVEEMGRVARELRALGTGRSELAVVRAALDGDDREVHRLLDGMDLSAVAAFRRALGTVATYAANKEGRLRAADRKRGW